MNVDPRTDFKANHLRDDKTLFLLVSDSFKKIVRTLSFTVFEVKMFRRFRNEFLSYDGFYFLY